MIEKISNDLNNYFNDEMILYVLRGFNCVAKKLSLKINHIFNLKIDEEINNLENVNMQDFISNATISLSSGKSCYCYMEELLFLEKNNLFGLLNSVNNYKITVIDIGCFNYYYPGFICNSYHDCIKKYDSDESIQNIYQKIYAEFTTTNDIPIINYNKLDNEDKCSFKNLYNMYGSEYVLNKSDEDKCVELLDNAPSERLVEIFFDALYGNINKIIYISVENKSNMIVEKFLYILNQLGINVEVRKNHRVFELPKNYSDYQEILQRISPSYDFREFKIYEDPFSSNNKIEVNQSVIIDNIYQNIIKAQKRESFRDIFVTAPTGAGKSILFQIPAIMAAEKLELVTIVISPLIGLMKDQVENIKKMTTCAETINSEYTPYEKEIIKKRIRDKECSILYISPETLLSNYDIKTLIGEREIGLLVVDEAHTVATWGKNFRPDYWYLGEYIDRLRRKQGRLFPIATFTATATISSGMNDMYHDIIESLNMTCDPFLGDVKRYNIKFDIKLCEKDHAYKEEKDEKVTQKINEYIKSGEKSLVYFPFVKNLNEIYDKVPKEKVGRYYGGLDKTEKDIALGELRTNDKNVMLATKAFGMGIDVSSIKNVYHFAPTGNLADYVQEIGRAARKPDEIGIASTDFYSEDFRYINKLYGLSRITDYNVVGVLQKLLFKYKLEQKRNFMISSEDFAHVFNAKTDDDVDNNLKATIIAIKRDFKYKMNFVPLIFKPRTMFTKGFFYIPDSKMILIRSYGWDKYLEEKYDGSALSLMSNGINTTYLGKVYEFNFKKCWEDNYNGTYDGITFGNFKRKFYDNELPGVDRTCMYDRLLLEVETKHDNTFEIACNVVLKKLDILRSVFDDMKMSSKQKRISEIADMYVEKDTQANKTLIHNIMNALVNIMIDFTTTNYANVDKFCNYNSKTDRYQISSSNYIRKINQIKKEIQNFILNRENDHKRIAIVDGSSNSVARSNPLIVGIQIMELFDLVTYTFTAGNKPEYFVRVNSESALQRIVNTPNYHSETLRNISEMHYDSIKYMTYFFRKIDNDEERWQFIEDYFLGTVDDHYSMTGIEKTDIKAIDDSIIDNPVVKMNDAHDNSIKIYSLYNSEDDESIQYYVSNTDIKVLDNQNITRLNPNTKVAEELNNHKQGGVFKINGEYEYLIDRIDHFDLTNEEVE